MKAITRKEQFYDAIINGTETPTPLTREEYILKDIAENSGGGGGDSGIFHINTVNNVNDNQLYYGLNIGGGSIVNMPQTQTAVIAIKNISLMVSAEENPSMNYKFVFDDPSQKSVVAVYNIESGMYTAAIDTPIAYQSDTITVTFVEEPR